MPQPSRARTGYEGFGGTPLATAPQEFGRTASTADPHTPQSGGPAATALAVDDRPDCALTIDEWVAGAQAPVIPGPRKPDPERSLHELYLAYYRSLVRLATMLVRDTATAEEITQDAFVAMHSAWPRLRDGAKALSYLRQSVVNRSRSVIRHRVVQDKYAPAPAPDMPGADHGAFARLERSDVVTALRGLPTRQREVLVLRYYADLSEADIAKTIGISQGAVKSHASRGLSALRRVLEPGI